MRETLRRRSSAGRGSRGLAPADLVILDGGKDQLSAGQAPSRTRASADSIAALAKEREELFCRRDRTRSCFRDVARAHLSSDPATRRIASRSPTTRRSAQSGAVQSVLDDVEGSAGEEGARCCVVRKRAGDARGARFGSRLASPALAPLSRSASSRR